MTSHEVLLQRDRRPLYEQAQSVIIEMIESGELKVGEKLPREEELASNLGVSRTTIRTTLGNLEALGYIRRVQGAGTFVAKQKAAVVNPLDTILPLHPHLMAKAGLHSELRNLVVEQMAAGDEVAVRLGVSEGTVVTKVSRTVVGDGSPIAHLIDYIPQTAATAEELKESFRGSVVDYFDGEDGKPLIAWSDLEIRAIRASAAVSEALEVSVGSILFFFDETFFAEDGTLISWSENYFCPDCITLRVERRRVVRDGGKEGVESAEGQTAASSAADNHTDSLGTTGE